MKTDIQSIQNTEVLAMGDNVHVHHHHSSSEKIEACTDFIPEFVRKIVNGGECEWIREKRRTKAIDASMRELFERMSEEVKSILQSKSPSKNPRVAYLEGQGFAFQECEEYEKALGCYTKAFVIEPGNIQILAKKYNISFKMGKYGEAVKHAQKFTEINPNNRFGWYCLGQAHNELKEYRLAVEAYRRACELDSENPWNWSCIGMALGEIKEYKSAVDAFHKACDLEPENPWNWNNLGNIHLDFNEYRLAVEAYRRACGLNQATDGYAEVPGTVWQNFLKESSIAMVMIEEACGLTPESRLWTSWFFLGNSHLELKEYRLAAEAFQKAHEFEPESTESWHNKGFALCNLGKYEEALACYSKALELDPEDPGSWHNKGDTLSEVGKYEEALACYSKALELDPERFISWGARGVASYFLKNYSDSQKCFEHILEKIDPGNVGALNGLGHLSIISRQYNEARLYLNRALNLDSEDTLIHFNLGILEYACGEMEKFENHIMKSTILDLDEVIQQLDVCADMGIFPDSGIVKRIVDLVKRRHLSDVQIKEIKKVEMKLRLD